MLDSLTLWPLVVIVEDCLMPDLAADLLTAVADYSNEDLVAQFDCAVMVAGHEVTLN